MKVKGSEVSYLEKGANVRYFIVVLWSTCIHWLEYLFTPFLPPYMHIQSFIQTYNPSPKRQFCCCVVVIIVCFFVCLSFGVLVYFALGSLIIKCN